MGVGGVAAVAATTAMLNSPLHIGPATDKPATANTPPASSDGQTAPPADPGGKAATPDTTSSGTPDAVPAGTAPAGAAAEGEKPVEADKDPYEGIAPEELPPDLQYDADSSVSFPTNI
jgi:hypothetical protein